jgi:hypothetical protein
MAKKTRKVLKQESQQRAIQQAVANVSALEADTAPAPVVSAPAAPTRAVKVELEEQREFAYVKSDVRRSLTLASIFAAVMIVLSFVLR